MMTKEYQEFLLRSLDLTIKSFDHNAFEREWTRSFNMVKRRGRPFKPHQVTDNVKQQENEKYKS